MDQTSLEEIRNKAHELSNQSSLWHFHILSPACTFNTTDQYAFILESAGESLVYYSDKPEKELGGELSPLLHRPESAEANSESITDEQQKILDTAAHLNEVGLEWHHHVLFPSCLFNESQDQFCLILENPETAKILRSVTSAEPKAALKLLEPLFYKS